MACYSPITVYRSAKLNDARKDDPEGKDRRRSLSLSSIGSIREEAMKLACGQCIGCRLDRSNDWALRCTHEAKMHGPERCAFVTLTYSDEHVPQSYSLVKEHLQLFHKRVYKAKCGVRYFACGEYGDEGLRPHWHTLLFGPEWTDLVAFRKNERGEWLYKSEEMSELWPYGFHEIGSVSFDSAAYVARYCVKRRTGKSADEYYYRRSPIDGEFYSVQPERGYMSRRPGIGESFARKFATDLFPSDFCVVDGRKRPVPKYYRSKLLSELEQRRLKLAHAKRANSVARKADRTPERLAVKHELHQRRLAAGGVDVREDL